MRVGVGKENCIGGVEITVKKKLSENICNIGRISNRSMCITIKTSGGNKIEIITTYAPHIGYNIGERSKYWAEISCITKKINKNECVIRCADSNGGESGKRIEYNIRKWAFRDKAKNVMRRAR